MILCACGYGMTVSVVTKENLVTDCDVHNQIVETFIEECLTDEKMRHLSLDTVI